jgi:hypothetical protein
MSPIIKKYFPERHPSAKRDCKGESNADLKLKK